MKSKAATYFLIIGVMIIWGIILWKILSAKDKEPRQQISTERAKSVNNAGDTLMLNYRDPFGGTLLQETKLPSKVGKASVPANVKSQPEVVEHRLRYLGKITQNKTVYGLVEINGILHTMKIGETVEDYKLNAIYGDSVRLLWKGNICSVMLNN